MPETLRELISRGPVDPSTAVEILDELLNTLEFAHWRGVTFGNITPERIVRTPTGQTTLDRRSVARAPDGSAPSQAATAAPSQAYAAPEQINGNPANERTDIFALGVVAYEMLTGKHPFGASDGLSAGSVADRILHDAPLAIPEAILASLPAHIPPALSVAMAKDPQDRFPDAISFLEALKGPTADGDAVVPSGPSLPAAAQPPVSRWRRKWLIGSVVGVLVVAALVVGLVLAFDGDPAPGSSTTLTVRDTTSTGPSALAIVTTTTATSLAPVSTIGTTTTIASTTTTAIVTTTTIAVPVRAEETDPYLAYAGAWSTTTNDSASAGSFSFVNSSEASVTVAFEGTYLAWLAKKSPAYGKAAVTLDGKNLGTIDLFSAGTGWQQKVWGTGTLKPGLHTVTIAWTGTKNPAATGTNICVDAFDVVGSLTQVP